MDQNGERRSRVPAGTFGSSQPPTPPAPSGGAEGAADRRRFIDTLTGQDASLSEAELAELEAVSAQPPAPPAEGETKRSGTGTLVGHPQVPSPQGPSPSAPVLSPPRWRGARAYLEGEEPQPRISSIPTPPITATSAPVKPVGVAIGVLRSKVTTKMGLPTKPVASSVLPGDNEPAIDDTIQQMLEHQASVPMQVEGSDDSIPELPLDELGAVLQDPSSPAVRTPVVTSTPPPPPAAALRSDPAPSRGADSPPPPPPPTQSPAAAGAGREREASSLAPPEVARRWRRPDSHVGLGALFIAAMALIGGGGWLLTQGGYFRTRVQSVAPVVAPKPVDEPAPAPGVPSNLAPPPAVPAQAPAPAPAASSTESATPARAESASERSARREARSSARTDDEDDRERKPKADEAEPSAEAEAEQDEPAPAAANDGEHSVLTVKPRPEPSGELPDTPSREDVIAALDPLRPSVNECAHGQRGTAQLDITVSSSGQVSHAVVGGDFAGTPEGSCIARAARTAQFTPFKKPRFRVIYPFQL